MVDRIVKVVVSGHKPQVVFDSSYTNEEIDLYLKQQIPDIIGDYFISTLVPFIKQKRKTKQKLDSLQFEEAILRYEKEHRFTNGIRTLYHRFTDTRKWFYEQFNVNRTEFDEHFKTLYFMMWTQEWNRDYKFEIAGGPPGRFTKTNFIAIKNKHYIFWHYYKPGDN